MSQPWRSTLNILVARGAVTPLFVILSFSLYIGWNLLLLHIDAGSGHVVHRRFVETQILLMGDWIAGAMLLLVVGWILHRRRIVTMLYWYATSCYLGAALVWAGYCWGTLSFEAGVSLMGWPLIGFILVKRSVVLLAFVVSLVALLALSLMSAYGLLPYAPYLVQPHDRTTALWWTSCHLYWASTFLLGYLLLAPPILGQWRRREAQALQLSLTDSMTGAHNRRSIIALLDTELAHSQRHGKSLAVALLDLDHFKHINDTWGHSAGDMVLRETVTLLKSCLRQIDAVGRFGGEEFLLLLPDTSPEGALQTVERCREKLTRLKLFAENGDAIRVSASFGLTGNDLGFEPTSEMLISAADAALYRAKQGGRNQVVQEDGPAQPLARSQLRRNVASSPRRQLAPLLKSLGSAQAWRQRIAGVLQWSPVAKAGLVIAIMTNMYATFLLWLLYVLHRQDHAQLINMAVMPDLVHLVLGFIGGAVLILASSLLLRSRRPDSLLFQHIALQYCGFTAAGLGYAIGILSMPTGIILVCLLLAGFILFEGVVALLSFITMLVAIVLIAYGCALGYMPYAPLLANASTAYQFIAPAWVLGNYLFVAFVLVVVTVLIDHVLGRWREREEEIHKLGLTDALTRVHNRHSIVSLLEKEVARTLRHGPPLAVVILDLDHFKQVNDTWGHPTGDLVLQTTTGVLSTVIRQCDTIGRFGGEEFLLLLQDTTMAGACALVERCRARLEETQVRANNGEEFSISASFGLASNEQCLELSAEVLIKAADQALYRAKAGGRNRVEAVAARLNRHSTCVKLMEK